MRALLPKAQEDIDLHAFYAADWLDHGGLRVNFISSADGAVTVDGLSRGLQTDGDNRIFAALRDLADVVLVGAGTVRAEGYGALRQSAARRATRRRYGLREALPLAVVSRSLRLDPTGPLFADAHPEAPTVLFTTAAADPTQRARFEQLAEVVICGDEDVDLTEAAHELARRGLERILCEGGPTLFADLVIEGVIDELCLTLSPLLAGPGAARITAGPLWPTAQPLDLVGLLEEDGALFCRYRVPRA